MKSRQGEARSILKTSISSINNATSDTISIVASSARLSITQLSGYNICTAPNNFCHRTTKTLRITSQNLNTMDAFLSKIAHKHAIFTVRKWYEAPSTDIVGVSAIKK